MIRTTNPLLILLATLAISTVAIGCGGSSKKKINGPGGSVDAPPDVGDSSPVKINRKVTREAKKDFAEAVAYYNKQAQSGWNKGSCGSAASRFEDVADNHPKLIEARFNAGVAYHNCGMDKKAEGQYKAALKIQAAHGSSLANLGKIYWDRGNESAAKQYWEQAIKADKKLAAPRNNLAWLQIRKIRARRPGSDFSSLEAQALRNLQSALAVENDNAEAYVLLSLLYMEGAKKNKSRLTLARLLLDKAEEANKGFAPLYNARGLLLMRQENPADALRMFSTALRLDPNFSEAHLNAGNVVLDFRKYDEAAAHFEAVLKRQPKNYEAAIGLGMAKRALRDFKAAEASYGNAAKIDPRRGEAAFNLGILYMSFLANQGDGSSSAKKAYKSAITHFRKAVNKPLASASLKKEANENIVLCQKQIKLIDDFAKSEAEFRAQEAKMKAEEAKVKATEKKDGGNQ